MRFTDECSIGDLADSVLNNGSWWRDYYVRNFYIIDLFSSSVNLNIKRTSIQWRWVIENFYVKYFYIIYLCELCVKFAIIPLLKNSSYRRDSSFSTWYEYVTVTCFVSQHMNVYVFVVVCLHCMFSQVAHCTTPQYKDYSFYYCTKKIPFSNSCS